MRKKVAVVAYETNPAVCSSMMMHVNMMCKAGFNIVLMVQNDVPHNLFSNVKYPIEYYDKPKELRHLFVKYDIDCIWCTNPLYVLVLLRLTKLPIYMWKQGDDAAESFLKHHSYLRKWVLQLLDWYIFPRVKGIIYVSNAMKEYYEGKYHVDNKSIVVPCLSEFAECVVDVERIHNSFVYIGGLAAWQCFDDILSLYAKIRTNDSIFHIITLDTATAQKKVFEIIGDSNNIEVYGIEDRKTIPSILHKFEYGFLIRKNDVTNLVASPIKFLEYLSCGVNVIMTNAVSSYAKLVEEYHIGTVVDIESSDIKINPYNNIAKKVYNENFKHDFFVKQYQDLIK